MVALDFLIRHQWIIRFFFGGVVALLSRKYGPEWLRSNWTRALSALPVPVIPLVAATGLSVVPIEIIPHTFLLHLSEPDRAVPANKKLLLFIHGWSGDPEETWGKFPSLAGGDRRFNDADIWVVNYPTYMFRRSLHIVELSQWLNAELDARKVVKQYDKVAVIAHSMGGLIAREIILLKRLREDQRTFGLLIEVASPHQGADYSTLASILGIGEPLTAEMQKDSSFLTTLATQWSGLPLKSRPQTMCFTSPDDDIVPQLSAEFQCDAFLPYPNKWGHTELVKPDGPDDSRYRLPMERVAQFLQD